MIHSLWASLIKFTKNLYPIVPAIFFLFAIVGIIRIFLKENTFLKVIAGLFIFQHVFQSATELIEGRFMIPLYPLYAILIIYGIRALYTMIRNQKSFSV